jgi:hypothetical protein
MVIAQDLGTSAGRNGAAAAESNHPVFAGFAQVWPNQTSQFLLKARKPRAIFRPRCLEGKNRELARGCSFRGKTQGLCRALAVLNFASPVETRQFLLAPSGTSDRDPGQASP